mmetsp:Transcript_15129/g.32070  ORF Transcript_15129/g.32070 Transcript_15129/m.32070 type:complete len:323 (-) Transcript_15129:32-1000(-)
MALLEDILREAGFSSSAIADVKAGKLHQGGSLDAASDKELSVKLAFHVKGKLENVAEIFLESPLKKEFDPAVESLGMIAVDGGDGSLEDFKGIKLTNEKVMDKLYQKAAPGSDLNLSKDEIAKFKKCKSHEEVENCLRQVLLDRFRAYKKNGLAGIAPYARSKKEFSPGNELMGQLKAGRILPKHSPAFNKYAMEYPNNKPEGADESYFWVNSIIDDKPTIALVHRVGMPQEGGFVYMERHFYLSRSHNCLQGIGAALPVEDGAVVLYATRTSTDQVSGFGGSAKRGIGNKLMGGRMADNFEKARKIMATAAAAKEMENLKV